MENKIKYKSKIFKFYQLDIKLASAFKKVLIYRQYLSLLKKYFLIWRIKKKKLNLSMKILEVTCYLRHKSQKRIF